MAIAKDKFAKVADKLLNDTFGEAQGHATFKNSGGYDPTTGVTTPPTTFDVEVTMTNFNQSQVDGERIRQGDRKMIVEEAKMGAFTITTDLTQLTYTGPKDTDTPQELAVIDKTEYPFLSVVIFQVRDK